MMPTKNPLFLMGGAAFGQRGLTFSEVVPASNEVTEGRGAPATIGYHRCQCSVWSRMDAGVDFDTSRGVLHDLDEVL